MTSVICYLKQCKKMALPMKLLASDCRLVYMKCCKNAINLERWHCFLILVAMQQASSRKGYEISLPYIHIFRI